MQQGMFIVLEGIDGTGKSTQVRLLADWFASKGRKVLVSREPTDGPWGRRLRESATAGRLPAEEELRCFLNDRREHVANTILPALSRGEVVVLDRYYFSTMAYQGLRGFDPREIRRLNEEFAPVPDRLVILDLDVEEALERIGARDGSANEFEKRESLEACRGVFLSLATEPFARVVAAQGAPDDVSRRIREALADLLDPA